MTKTPNFGCHNSYPAPSPHNQWNLQVELSSGGVWSDQGILTFSVIQLAGIANDGEFRQIESNQITINVASASGLARTWGEADKGVRADLTLDQKSYALGRDVPLHIATEDIGSASPIFDAPYGNHMGAVGMSALPYSFLMTVEDELGQPIKASSLTWAGSFRPLPCPTAYTKNSPRFREVSLRDFGLLPEKTGLYHIFFTWAPYTTKYETCDKVPADRRPTKRGSAQEPPITVVKSNVQTIRIVDGKTATQP